MIDRLIFAKNIRAGIRETSSNMNFINMIKHVQNYSLYLKQLTASYGSEVLAEGSKREVPSDVLKFLLPQIDRQTGQKLDASKFYAGA